MFILHGITVSSLYTNWLICLSNSTFSYFKNNITIILTISCRDLFCSEHTLWELQFTLNHCFSRLNYFCKHVLIKSSRIVRKKQFRLFLDAVYIFNHSYQFYTLDLLGNFHSSATLSKSFPCITSSPVEVYHKLPTR